MWEALVGIVSAFCVIFLALVGGIYKLMLNHFKHHQDDLDPKVNKIAEDVAFIKGKFDL